MRQAWPRIPALVALAALFLAVGPGGLRAQDRPLQLTIEARKNAAQERQERLLRRMERQSEYWFRSICTHCGDSWKHQIYAPFHPLDALGGERPATAGGE